MNINATLLGQTIMFAMFVWFCMKFVWPPIMAALEERKKQIADGLAAAERGKQTHNDEELCTQHWDQFRLASSTFQETTTKNTDTN